MPARSTTRRRFVALAASVVMLALLSCRVEPIGGAAGQETESHQAPHLSLHTDRPTYPAGRPVQFRLTLSNPSSAPLTLHCLDAQRFDVTVFDPSGKQIWRWSEDQMFAQMVSEETIKPGEARTHTAVFSGALPPGEYRASGLILCLEPPVSAHTAFTVR
jgi:hypothetical protein